MALRRGSSTLTPHRIGRDSYPHASHMKVVDSPMSRSFERHASRTRSRAGGGHIRPLRAYSSIFSTCRPRYVPHAGHTLCGSRGAWHCGHSPTVGPSIWCVARRVSLRVREVFFLGTATWAPFSSSHPRTRNLYRMAEVISRARTVEALEFLPSRVGRLGRAVASALVQIEPASRAQA